MEFHPVPQNRPSPSGGDASAAAAPGSPNDAANAFVLSEAASAARSWQNYPALPNRDAQMKTGLRMLRREQLESFDRDGFLHVQAEDVWSPAELKLLLDSVDQLQQLPDKKGAWMKYYETDRRDPTAAKLLCRMENFTQYNPGLDYICNGDKLPAMASDLFGERSILYKEKVNMKLPGADGFAPHQDVAAGWWLYGQSLHISCLVSIDPATVENGCLEVVSGRQRDGLLGPDWKEIPLDVVDKMKFQHVPTKPGDVLFFDSYVPHKSAPNDTDKSRRVLYVTYAKASEGDFRARYYADKRAAFPPDIEREPGKNYAYKI